MSVTAPIDMETYDKHHWVSYAVQADSKQEAKTIAGHLSDDGFETNIQVAPVDQTIWVYIFRLMIPRSENTVPAMKTIDKVLKSFGKKCLFGGIQMKTSQSPDLGAFEESFWR